VRIEKGLRIFGALFMIIISNLEIVLVLAPTNMRRLSCCRLFYFGPKCQYFIESIFAMQLILTVKYECFSL